jgi:hypothetical protein
MIGFAFIPMMNFQSSPSETSGQIRSCGYREMSVCGKAEPDNKVAFWGKKSVLLRLTEKTIRSRPKPVRIVTAGFRFVNLKRLQLDCPTINGGVGERSFIADDSQNHADMIEKLLNDPSTAVRKHARGAEVKQRGDRTICKPAMVAFVGSEGLLRAL